MKEVAETGLPDVSIFPVVQATAAIFPDLYFQSTVLFFVEAGTKRVLCPINGELIGKEGDLMIFPPGSMVTMENRPSRDKHYRATGVSFHGDLIESVFSSALTKAVERGVQVVLAGITQPAALLPLVRETLANVDLPPYIRRHRLLEPLIWLLHNGYHLASADENRPLTRVRRLIEKDLCHEWQASEVADHLAVSEPTMRRQLARSGQGFSRILLHTRLEHGLSQLQTTNAPVSQIALDCGFKTPSHFSDAFRKRFGIRPREIRIAAN